MWLAGGGIKGGTAYGQTDELASTPPRILSTFTISTPPCCDLLGIDHERLTFKYQGREFRLTDVGGKVVQGLLA